MFRRLIVLLCLLPIGLSPQDPKRKPKPPLLEVLSVAAERSAGVISIDGTVRNTGERPAEGVTLSFNFFAPGQKPVTTKKGPLESEVLEPGEETEFRLQMHDPGRVVSFRIQAEDKTGRELSVVNAGPFPIQ